MKAEEKIKKELIENMIIKQERMNMTIDRYVGAVKKAETVEEMMAAKREVLVNLLKCLPLTPDDCYFCVSQVACEECGYAREHGRCKDVDSDYRKICSLCHDLMWEIKVEYYRGEKYI